jgi:hypothetical protein
MNKQQVMDAMHHKDASEQFDTVLHLGAALTVAARAAYPASDANIEHLVGFNEMQHRVYGWLRHPQTEDKYPVEHLFETLFATATQYGIDGDLGWAVKTSMHFQS